MAGVDFFLKHMDGELHDIRAELSALNRNIVRLTRVIEKNAIAVVPASVDDILEEMEVKEDAEPDSEG